MAGYDPNTIREQPDARQKARHFARYSRYDYIAWESPAGLPRWARLTEQTIKRAMLDVGTQGRVSVYDRSGGQSYRWPILNNIRINLKHGWYAHG